MTQMSWSDREIKASMKSVLKAEPILQKEPPISDREAVFELLSHDLKTPLIGSSQLISLILDGSAGELNPELTRLLNLIQQTNFEVLDLVQGLLEIYRYDGEGEIIQVGLLDMNELLSELEETLAPEAQQQSIAIEVCPATPTVFASANRRAALQAVTMLASQLLKVRSDCSKVFLGTRQEKSRAILSIRFVGLSLPVDCLELFSGALKSEKAVSHAFKPAKFAMHVARRIIAATDGTIECRVLDDKNAFHVEIALPIGK